MCALLARDKMRELMGQTQRVSQTGVLVDIHKLYAVAHQVELLWATATKHEDTDE